MKKNKVTVFDGQAQAGRQGQARGREGRQAGRRPQPPSTSSWPPARGPDAPGLEPDGKLVWTYREAMVPEAMPKSLLVVGSGAIGIEFASFYRTLGAEVTVVEVLDRILPVEDEEICAFARKAFEKQGMKILTGAKVKTLKKGADNVTATIEADGKTQDDHGRPRHLGRRHRRQCREHRPGGTGVKVDRTHVVIDEWLPHRRARPLRHRRRRRPALAGAQGQPRGRDLRRDDRRPQGRASARRRNIPGCTYCRPQVASVGLTEAKAKAGRPRGQGRPLPLHRQRQGDRAGRAGGLGQDGVRRQDRRAAGRPHDRRRGDRDDPGLRHRHDPGDHRGRADAHASSRIRRCPR